MRGTRSRAVLQCLASELESEQPRRLSQALILQDTVAPSWARDSEDA